MELIRITDEKIKIMLTPSDLTLYELDPENDSAASPAALRRLLGDVRLRFGVELDDRSVSAQYFPSRSGGGELFVCSIRPKHGEGAGAPLSLTGCKNAAASFRWEGAYRFPTMQALLSACHRLTTVDFLGDSAAYCDRGGRYYLLLRTHARSPFSIPEELSFLTEYGDTENAAQLKIYIKEHGELIRSPDAVSVLALLK